MAKAQYVLTCAIIERNCIGTSFTALDRLVSQRRTVQIVLSNFAVKNIEVIRGKENSCKSC